ncbi:MAG: polysaccharide biosynthesis/export family protein [Longimicrobiales bacterium]
MLIAAFRGLLVLAACITCLRSDAVAQNLDTWDGRRLQLTRAELELLLQKFEQTGRSTSWTNEFRLHAEAEAERVRRRLVEGDFQIGDQIELSITGEEKLPGPLTVGPGRTLVIPGFSEVALAGVLRSELNDRVQKHMDRFIKASTVRTRSYIRILVTGNVNRPGFVPLPAESIISDVITGAGGPNAAAKLASARIERGSERILDGRVLQEAIAEGRTLDQMSLRSGDQFHVPAETAGRGSSLLRAVTIIPTAILAITGLLQIL